MAKQPQWEHFAHEADIGVRGKGPDLASAFAMGALALTNVVTDARLVKPIKSFHLHCCAPDVEILFADWLNALIYKMETENMLFADFQVQIQGLNLDAIIKGEAVDKTRHQPVVDVKGATYTELRVYQQAEQWIAQCVVDV